MRKEKNKKRANLSTTVSSLSESDEGFNTQQLFKKKKLKKKKSHHHKGKILAFAFSTSASKPKFSTYVTFESSALKSKSKRLTTARPKTTEQEEEHFLVISDEEQEAIRTEREKLAFEVPETIAVP